MKLGEQLKHERHRLGVTQAAVADTLHISRQTISSWENERSYPDIASLIALSDYYQLSLDQLLKVDNGLADDLAHKEQALQAAYKIWLLSYGSNLVLLVLFLADQFGWFGVKLSNNVALFFVVILLLHAFLLPLTSERYQQLKPTKNRLSIRQPLWWGLAALLLLGVVIFALVTRTFLSGGLVIGAILVITLYCYYYNH